MRTTITTLLSLLLVSYSIAADVPASDDEKNIQGTWIVEKAMEDGAVLAEIFDQVVFAGEQLTMSDKSGREKKGSFKLDATKTPKVLVFPAQHPANVLPTRWAYALDGNTLKLVNSAPNKPITEISDKRQLLVILKKRQ